MSDATPEFKQQLKEAFDTIQVGQTFTFRRTFTDGDVTLFCGVTGDYNPYHIDEPFIQSSWFGRRIVPGLLTASMATHIGGMIGFLATEKNNQYVQADYVGDTITSTVTFIEKDEAKRMLSAKVIYVNQDGVDVLTGTFSGFTANVRLAR